MNKAQHERATKAHAGYLALLEKRKNTEAFKPEPPPKQVRKVKPRWPVGSSVWVPSGKAEGRILEAVSDILGDWAYVVEYWGHLKPVRKRFEESQLEDIDHSNTLY